MGAQRRMTLLSLIPLRASQRTMSLKDFLAADPGWPGVNPALLGPSPPKVPGLSLFQEVQRRPCPSLDRGRVTGPRYSGDGSVSELTAFFYFIHLWLRS